jgi:hypothetical protein
MAPSAKTTPVTKTKKKRFGSAKRKRLKAVRAELATDPDYSASTADLSSATGMRDALQKLLARQAKHEEALQLSLEENESLRDRDTAPSKGSAPKAMNNPVFPETCVFDPERRDGMDIQTFISDFEDIAELVDSRYKLHHLRLRLSRDVRTLLKQENQRRHSAGKSKLKYRRTVKWLVKAFAARDATDKLFQQLTKLRQGKSSMQVFLTRFQCKVDELDARGESLTPYVQRKFMLDGIDPTVRARATEIPEYYTMDEAILKEKLIALDESIDKKSASVRALSETEISDLCDARIDSKIESVRAISGNGGGGGGGGRGRGGKTRGKSKFTQGTMKCLYTAEQWAARIKAIEDKIDPSDSTVKHLYEKDCYPIAEGKPAKDAQPACVWCRTTGHRISDCRAFKRK